MKLNLMVYLGVLLLAAQVSAEVAPVLKTQQDKMNYAIGVNMVGNLKLQGIEVDPGLVMKGMQDAFSGGELLLNNVELRKAISQYQNMLRQKQAAKSRTMVTEGIKKTGEAFLAENKKKEGVVTLPSGLQYKILKAGDGKKPTDTDIVEYNYRGTLISGSEFDSSYRTGQPAISKVSVGVIPGLSEALKLMAVGSRWQIFVPAQLAYGERGLENQIGPNETLIFELELLAIK